MDKYGVVTDDEKTKTAGTTEKCPQCGGPINRSKRLTEEYGTPWCEKCGTEPFEKRPESVKVTKFK